MKRLIVGAAIVILAVGMYYFLNRNRDTTIAPGQIEFAMTDVEKVNKVIMQNRGGRKVILEKKGETWWVNDEYPALKAQIDILLNKTLKNIEVKGPVSASAKDNVIRNMVGSAIKVSVYQNGKLSKSYYVGGPNPDQTGTYMHMEGSTSPFVAYIPGVDGYITPKFHLIKEDWYSRSIFDYKSDEIRSIHVEYTENPIASFTLSRTDSIYDIQPRTAGKVLDQIIAKSYFALYKFKNFEGFADYLSKEVKDSIRRSNPFIRISLKPVEGDMVVLNVFRKGSNENKSIYDKKGNILAYDAERYFATFSGFPKLVSIQDYTFGELFVKRDQFYR